MRTMWRLAFLITGVFWFPQCTFGDEIRVAVASNFTIASERLIDAFNETTGHKAVPSYGSTGKHYAQIKNGAPVNILLAADSLRPRRLVEEGVAIKGTRFTYAIGRLVIWSPVIPVNDRTLESDFEHLAIANENLAPYGRAAKEYLSHRGVWEKLQQRLVRGENVNQALQFVRSGNAELGLIALSQVRNLEGFTFIVPAMEYSPVVQQAVLISEKAAARSFLAYLQSMEARGIIESCGYALP